MFFKRILLFCVLSLSTHLKAMDRQKTAPVQTQSSAGYNLFTISKSTIRDAFWVSELQNNSDQDIVITLHNERDPIVILKIHLLPLRNWSVYALSASAEHLQSAFPSKHFPVNTNFLRWKAFIFAI